ncbi:hypothetical protein M5K25_009296 [Dendrobium thyrsiflorum]|uniref:Uncharacterized protein n=1 Tax=Dendrobium thyrsiflorum TaxID=117978 RepID=A0ABD0V5G2_DENTH
MDTEWIPSSTEGYRGDTEQYRGIPSAVPVAWLSRDYAYLFPWKPVQSLACPVCWPVRLPGCCFDSYGWNICRIRRSNEEDDRRQAKTASSETIGGHGRGGNPNPSGGRENSEVEVLEGDDGMPPLEPLSREELSRGYDRREAEYVGRREEFYRRGAGFERIQRRGADFEGEMADFNRRGADFERIQRRGADFEGRREEIHRRGAEFEGIQRRGDDFEGRRGEFHRQNSPRTRYRTSYEADLTLLMFLGRKSQCDIERFQLVAHVMTRSGKILRSIDQLAYKTCLWALGSQASDSSGLDKYIRLRESQAETGEESSGDLQIILSTAFGRRRLSRFSFVAVPIPDAGPSPCGGCSASLGACTVSCASLQFPPLAALSRGYLFHVSVKSFLLLFGFFL